MVFTLVAKDADFYTKPHHREMITNVVLPIPTVTKVYAGICTGAH